MNDCGVPILELQVPKFRRVVMGAVLLMVFILSFVLLAVYNLRSWTAIIPSTLWLLLVGFVVGGFIKTDGWKKFATDILGAFAWREFIRTIRREDGSVDFQYGFWMFGQRFAHFTVVLGNLETVEWSSGQSSHRAGRDMNDWNVVVWYDHDDRAKSQKARSYTSRQPDQDLYIIGMSGPKAETAELGRAVLDLLRQSGATFVQGENDCTFVGQPASAAQP